jgi:hypothetical protein
MTELTRREFVKLKEEVKKISDRNKELEKLLKPKPVPTPKGFFKFELKTPIKMAILPGTYFDISKIKGEFKKFYTVTLEEAKSNDIIKYSEIEIHSIFLNQNPGWHDLEFGPIKRRIATDNFVEQTPCI